MSKTLTETATFTATVTCPVDGDARNAASVEAGLQPLANRTKYLNAYPLRGNYNSTACTDGNVNVDTSLGDVFKIPSTLTGNRTYTLINGSSIPAGSMKRFYRPGGADAFTLQINAGTASITFTASVPAWAEFLWDGADWHVPELLARLPRARQIVRGGELVGYVDLDGVLGWLDARAADPGLRVVAVGFGGLWSARVVPTPAIRGTAAS